MRLGYDLAYIQDDATWRTWTLYRCTGSSDTFFDLYPDPFFLEDLINRIPVLRNRQLHTLNEVRFISETLLKLIGSVLDVLYSV